MKEPLNFPAPSAKDVWDKINQELEVALPLVFTKHKFAKLSTTELQSKLETWLYNFFLEKFGKKERNRQGKSHIQRPERVHKGLARLRESKRQCKAARKALHKAGMKGSEEDKLITGLWRRLLKQHNRLRIAVNKRKTTRAKIKEEKRFRSDPHRYAKCLFSKDKRSAAPTFSAEDAQQYFSTTIRDEEREHEYAPLPGTKRPPPPSMIFS